MAISEVHRRIHKSNAPSLFDGFRERLQPLTRAQWRPGGNRRARNEAETVSLLRERGPDGSRKSFAREEIQVLLQRESRRGNAMRIGVAERLLLYTRPPRSTVGTCQ